MVDIVILCSMSGAGHHAAAPASTTHAVSDNSSKQDSADSMNGQFIFYHDYHVQKTIGKLPFLVSNITNANCVAYRSNQ